MVEKILKLRFVLLAIIIILLIIAAFAEKNCGSSFAQNYIYHAVWFFILCGLCVCLFLIYSCTIIKISGLTTLFFSVSIALVLCGGLKSYFSAKNSIVHLRKNIVVDQIIDNNKTVKLPFQLKLNNFEIVNYKGTNVPADFISYFDIIDKDKAVSAHVSMNNVFRYKTYRFFQTSYDNDLQGTVLTINEDFYGSILVYCGFILFLITILIYGIKNYISLRIKKNTKSFVLLGVLTVSFLFSTPLSAQRTLDKNDAKKFGKLAIFYQNRICPLNSYAHDFTIKLYGKATYKNFTSEQVLAGWLFFPEEWQYEKMVKLKNGTVREKLILKKYAKFSDFFMPTGESKLYYLNISEKDKFLREANEKINLVFALADGSSLKFFPQNNVWYASTDNLENINSEDTIFIANILQFLYEAIEYGQHDDIQDIINNISKFQNLRVEQGGISELKFKIEIVLNKFNFPKIFFPILFFLAFISFVSFFLKNKYKLLKTLVLIANTLILTICALFIILRTYVVQHLPFSNAYETMLLMSFMVLLIATIFRNKSEIVFFGGQILAACCLLVCNLNALDPQLSPLVPVLNSSWLSIHVSLMMISYSLCALITLLSIICLGQNLIRKKISENVENLTQKFLKIALIFMFSGIISGSVWANQSWGRYWGWDPKEVWALITGLFYLFPILAQNNTSCFRNNTFKYIYLIFCFLSLLMTYFGVNIWLGGVHAY